MNNSQILDESRYSLKSETQNVYDQLFSQKNISMPIFHLDSKEKQSGVERITKLNLKMESLLLYIESLRFKLSSVKNKVDTVRS